MRGCTEENIQEAVCVALKVAMTEAKIAFIPKMRDEYIIQTILAFFSRITFLLLEKLELKD